MQSQVLHFSRMKYKGQIQEIHLQKIVMLRMKNILNKLNYKKLKNKVPEKTK